MKSATLTSRSRRSPKTWLGHTIETSFGDSKRAGLFLRLYKDMSSIIISLNDSHIWIERV